MYTITMVSLDYITIMKTARYVPTRVGLAMFGIRLLLYLTLFNFNYKISVKCKYFDTIYCRANLNLDDLSCSD